MSTHELRIGDVVKLRSGGPTMTVIGFSTSLNCIVMLVTQHGIFTQTVPATALVPCC